MTQKIKVGIVGGTGYTGIELMRLLLMHPMAQLIWITSRSQAGQLVSDIFPSLRYHTNLVYQNFSEELFLKQNVDVVFFATPHGVAMKTVPKLIEVGIKVVDLGADFRLQSIDDFEKWYKHTHTCQDLLKQAVYGLPEVNRQYIRSANLIANPGCYPTTSILGLKPIIDQQNDSLKKNGELLIDSRIIIDAKSGVSGSGRQAKIESSYSELSDNFKAYGIAGHRHLPEIEQGIDLYLNSQVSQRIRFLPHLVPMIRGMFTSIHIELTEAGVNINWQKVFEQCYRNEDFIDVLPQGSLLDTRSVRSSNQLRIAIYQDNDRHELTIMVVQDNLVKGAAGQAVQNMNILFNIDEKLGLLNVPVVP